MFINNFNKKLNIGTHIIPLPIDREYNIDELFDSALTGSFFEKLDANGKFTRKEKVLFENNEFIVSDIYKTLKPFDIIRLTLKRPIIIKWKVSFTSSSFIKKQVLKINDNYNKKEALHLMQLCSLIYEPEKKIKEKITQQYKFNDFFYFSKRSHKSMWSKGFLKLFYIFLKSRISIVDLQFMKLSRYDKDIKKEIIILVFQGSQELEDWITNISMKETHYFGKEKVHQGFYDSLKIFLRTISNKKFSTKEKKMYHLNKDIDFLNENCKIILTGHSLGGAIATLAGCYFHDLGIKKENISIYTFGAPPVGDEAFSTTYEFKLNLYRVINENDIVPKLDKITRLRHFGEEIKLQSNENEIHICSDYIDNLIDALQYEN